jgi:type I restriction enzyme M protein
MARVRKLGYDVKGQPIYKRDEGGRVLKSASGAPLIDEDVTVIAEGYATFKSGGKVEESDDIFVLPRESLNSRLDVEHYLPSDRLLLKKLVESRVKRLGELAEIVTEGDEFRLSGDDDIRYVAISDIDAHTLQIVSQQTMKAHEAPSRATYRLRAGDIVTAVSGASTGTPKHATALIGAEEDGAICSNGLAVLRNVHGVHPLFLLCYMRTDRFLRQVRRLMTGHAIPAISLEDLATVLVPVLPEDQQEKIANTTHELLALRRKALRAGEELVAEVESFLNGASQRRPH